MKEIIKITAESNKIKKKKKNPENQGTQKLFFKKIDKPLPRLNMKETQITEIRNDRGSITTILPEVKKKNKLMRIL